MNGWAPRIPAHGRMARGARITLIVTAMFVLGAAGHHTARCHTVWGVARVCNASAGSAPRTNREDARRFAVALLARWNARVGPHGFPADLAVCTPYPPPDGSFYDCVWRVWWPTQGRFRCRVGLLDRSITEWRGWWEPCRGAFAPKAGAA